MKINEFKTVPTKQVDEALSDWIGDTGSAIVKGMFTGKGVEQQMTQDIFIKDFTRDAFTSLDNGIKSGLINPNSGGGAAPAAPGAAAPAAPGAPATKRPGLGGRVQQNLNNLRNPPPPPPPPAPGAAPAKPTPAPGAAPAKPTPAPGAAPAKPTPAPGPGGGVNYTAGQSPAVNLKTAPPPPPPPPPIAVAITKDGRRARALDPLKRPPKPSSGPIRSKPNSVKESSYDRLNAIFENIVLGEDGNQESIEQYLMSWYQKYMQGVAWNSRKPNVEAAIKAVADTYGRDKGKQALTKLAQLSYTISKTSGGVPKGIEQDLAAMKKDGGGTGGASPTGGAGGGNTPGGAGGGSPTGGAGGGSNNGTIRQQADNIIHDIQTQHNEDQPALVNYLRKRLDQSFPAAKTKLPTQKAPAAAPRAQGKPNLTSVKK